MTLRAPLSILPRSSLWSAFALRADARVLARTAAAGLLALGLACFGAAAIAEEGASDPVSTDHLKTRLVSSQDAAVPGEPFHIGLLLEHDPHWHTYWKNPGDSGLPTTVTFTLPAGVAAGPIEWPLPDRMPFGDLMNFGYSGTALLPMTITLPADYSAKDVAIKAKAEWLVCEHECIPGSAEYTVMLPVAPVGAPLAAFDKLFRQAESRQPVAAQDATAKFSVDGDDIVIRFEGKGWPAGLDQWTLFPGTSQIVGNAVPVRWDTGGRTPTARVARSEYFAGAPESLDLLIAKGAWGIEVAADRTGPSGAPGTTAPSTAGAGSLATPSAAGRSAAPVDDETSALGIGAAIVFAFLGGLVLNLMPCVFPVLFIKAAGALESAHDAPRLRRHSLLYTAGVVVSFVLIAAVLLALRDSGSALGWGFQLQDPWFVAVLVFLMVVMALSFAGLVEIGASFAGVGQRLTEGGGNASAFFTGALACVVASPCTAPFMGPALGYALTQPAIVALLVFASLGLGMAMPMLLLGFVPRLATKLPRPGPWMATFRQFMAFPLLLTAAWLLWVYGEQTSVTGMWQLLSAMIGVAFAFWLFARVGAFRRRGAAVAARVVAGFVFAVSVAWPLVLPAPIAGPETTASTEGGISVRPYTEATLAALRASGSPVLVNMTAAWCITCLANERVALSKQDVVADMTAHKVAYLKGDWTRRDPAITKYLESFGRSGVPLYVLYPAGGGDPVVLPQILTPGVMQDALAATR